MGNHSTNMGYITQALLLMVAFVDLIEGKNVPSKFHNALDPKAAEFEGFLQEIEEIANGETYGDHENSVPEEVSPGDHGTGRLSEAQYDDIVDDMIRDFSLNFPYEETEELTDEEYKEYVEEYTREEPAKITEVETKE